MCCGSILNTFLFLIIYSQKACGEILKTENGIEESHKNAVEATIQFFISRSKQSGIQVNDEFLKKINEETTLLKPIFDIFITNNIKVEES